MRLHAIAANLAEQQLGLVARRQLVAEGVSPNTIDAAVRRQHLVPIERGVYRLPGAPETPETRLLARALSIGDEFLFSHRTAAWLWDLLDAPTRHEISVPRGRRARATRLRVHESTDLAIAIPGSVRGLPVTGVGRTILDCAGDATIDIERLVDGARRHHDISRSLLPSTIVSHARSGRPGIQRLRDLVVGTTLPDSDFERLVIRWLDDEGIEGWEHHHRFVVPGFGPVELDFGWPAEKVALELEGADHRDRVIVHDDDTERQNRIVLAGWDVVRVTYRRWIRHTTAVLRELQAMLTVAAEKRSSSPVP